MHCHQRRRAGRVQGDGRADEAEGVGDAARDHRVRGTQQDHALAALAGAELVVLVHRAREDGRGGTLQGVRVDARALQGLPGDLQQHALLRVHAQGFARRDAEEVGVELARTLQEATLVAGRQGEHLGVPAAVGRERADAVLPVDDHLPQIFGTAHPAGEAAADADHGDRFRRGRFEVLQAPLGALKVRTGPAEVVPELLFVVHPSTHLETRPVRNPRVRAPGIPLDTNRGASAGEAPHQQKNVTTRQEAPAANRRWRRRGSGARRRAWPAPEWESG